MISFKIENAQESYITVKDLNKIVEVMHVISKNIECIPVNTYHKQSEGAKEMYKDYKFFSKSDDIIILVDLKDQYDEFYIQIESVPSNVILSYIEVVYKDIAISTDMCFDTTIENLDNYELGNTYSLYTQIGKTDYYYREL